MSPRDLAFRVLLISIVRFSTSIRPQNSVILRLLTPEPARRMMELNLEFNRNKPQIEIQLIKDHVLPDKNWMLINEYKYSDKNYNDAAKLTSTTDEKKIPQIENGNVEIKEKEKENDIEDNTDRFSSFGFRNIITVNDQSKCPEGKREDSNGLCRTVIS